MKLEWFQVDAIEAVPRDFSSEFADATRRGSPASRVRMRLFLRHGRTGLLVRTDTIIRNDAKDDTAYDKAHSPAFEY
ncbi:hypothetical protein WHZ78_10245 [Bradyrhizobium symbiodeficiens]|uniref:hypothetical protein n=1 Tax=Bradyrhizobium symbiodeficiens TaxID=1404367 RepID=UPI0030CCEF37